MPFRPGESNSVLSLLRQAAVELSAPEASASPVIDEAGAQAEPERKPPSVRHSSRVIGAFLSQVKDTAAKVCRRGLAVFCLLVL